MPIISIEGASAVGKTTTSSEFDIDLFQPLWYNWSFDFTLFGGQSMEYVAGFYRALVAWIGSNRA